MDVDIGQLSPALCVGFDLATADGVVVLRSYQTDAAYEDWPPLHARQEQALCEIPPGLLNDGRYLVLPRVSLHRSPMDRAGRRRRLVRGAPGHG